MDRFRWPPERAAGLVTGLALGRLGSIGTTILASVLIAIPLATQSAIRLAGPDTHGQAAIARQAVTNTEVDLELVLAVDVSGSMSASELETQRRGYVAALRHSDTGRAVGSGQLQRIAITYVEWAGENEQRIVVPWTILSRADDAIAFAARLEAAPIPPAFPAPPWLTGTSISAALTFSADLIATNEFIGLQRVIDISGDGANNSGGSVQASREAVVAQGIVINGLPIAISNDGFPIDVYYEDCVIGGAGSFSLPVWRASQLEEAIQRKLTLEIAGLQPRFLPASLRQAEVARIDCATDGVSK